jgi:hypothetical protein
LASKLNSGISRIDRYTYKLNSTYDRFLTIAEKKETYGNSSWYAGGQLEAKANLVIAKFYCKFKGMYRQTESFSETKGGVNSLRFEFKGMVVDVSQRFAINILSINISTLKTYLSSQNILPKEKPFFVPTLNMGNK